MNTINIWEVSDTYRMNISRRRINRKQKSLKQSLESQANSLCKDKLTDRYIHNAFSKYDSGYVYYNTDEDEILGFCLWKLYDTRLHILLLCSKYPEYALGKTMINDIEYYCFENKIKSITVAPADIDLFSYYSHLGFKITDTDSTQMIKYLQPFTLHRRRKNKTRRSLPTTKRNYPSIATMMPINMDIYKNQLD
jgi:hypothetical protein